MAKFQHLLLPTDFSELAEATLGVAIDFARRLDADITLMHAYYLPPIPYGGPFAWPIEDLEVAAHDRLDELLAKARAQYPACRSFLAQGDPREQIIEAATQCSADVIVMGTHGRRGVARLMLGSVTEEVVRTSPVPVLVVPPNLAPRL